MKEKNILEQFRVKPGEKFRLKDHKTGWAGTPEMQNLTKAELKSKSREYIAKNIAELAVAQELLWASDTYSMLVVLQAMDAAGKDSTIKHVMSGINPQGCTVTSFKAPSLEELDHAYLWRCMKVTPAKGDIGIFNRSYYEEVLVTRVHPEILATQRLPLDYNNITPDQSLWLQRYTDINNYEKYLINNGTIILKFFLNVSKDEQKRRFLKRIEDPGKNWKFSDRDVVERNFWKDYQTAYEQTFQHTSTALAPW